jgi:predicted MFS family arabinose efflux permease
MYPDPSKPLMDMLALLKGTHGLSAQHLSLIKVAKHLQWNALYPLPAIAACLLCLFYLAHLLFRNRSDKKTRYVVFALWISCVIGFVAALIPMMLGQALYYAAPVFGSQVEMSISLGNVVGTWIAFRFHLSYALAAVWWHRKVGGAGGCGLQVVDEEVRGGMFDQEMAQMQYPP